MKWEYRTVKMDVAGFFGPKVDEEDISARLNELGYEGWELVSAFDTNYAQGTTRDIILLFKRALER